MGAIEMVNLINHSKKTIKNTQHPMVIGKFYNIENMFFYIKSNPDRTLYILWQFEM